MTLATSGSPQSVVVEGDLAGTTVGNCVAGQFRTVKVRPFTGSAVTLVKSFVIPD